MNSDLIPELHPDTVWRVLDDGAIIVTPRAGNVRVLNRVGTSIWQLIDGKTTLAEIELALVDTFDTTLEQARQDLAAFMDELERREMIRWRRASDFSI